MEIEIDFVKTSAQNMLRHLWLSVITVMEMEATFSLNLSTKFSSELAFSPTETKDEETSKFVEYFPKKHPIQQSL